MNRTLFVICTALAAGGCQGPSESNATSNDTRSTPSSNPTTTTLSNRPAEQRPAEAPALNVPASTPDEPAADPMSERDRSGVSATPDEHAASEADQRVTREIQQALSDDARLAMVAKEVEITTLDGVVTLRGPVKSREEKAQVAAVAQRVNGILRIDNRLDIVKP
ncbi:MAG TPA: BON domain-containing protein [Polyangiaceae bacterium]|nr:BON domain-containing protein [Polyangiaceae bacterium]